MLSADPELNIFEIKGAVIGLSPSAFARTKQKEKGKCYHVGDSLIAVIGCGARNTKEVTQDLDRNRLNAIRGRIFVLVAGNLSRDAKVYLAAGVQTRVVGPHRRKRLSNGSQRVLHCSSLHRVVMGGNLPCAISLSADLECGNRVFDFREGRIQAERGAEVAPCLPVSFSGGGS